MGADRDLTLTLIGHQVGQIGTTAAVLGFVPVGTLAYLFFKYRTPYGHISEQASSPPPVRPQYRGESR